MKTLTIWFGQKNYQWPLFQVKASNNYLALRNTTGEYYLNGNWRIDYPQKMDIAGMHSSFAILQVIFSPIKQ